MIEKSITFAKNKKTPPFFFLAQPISFHAFDPPAYLKSGKLTSVRPHLSGRGSRSFLPLRETTRRAAAAMGSQAQPQPQPQPLGEGSTLHASRGRSITLYGELKAEEIEKINAEKAKGWLFLNPEASFPEAARSAVPGLAVAACVPPLRVPAMDEALEKAQELLQGPSSSLVVQCSTAQRAGAVAAAALLLSGDDDERAPSSSSSSAAAALSLARSAPFKFASNPGVFNWLERWAASKEQEEEKGGKTTPSSSSSSSSSPLLFRQLFEAESSTYTYLLADSDTKEAVLIDPVLETAERDAKVVEELGLELVFAINT